MSFSNVTSLALIATLTLGSTARAQCYVCDEVVELTDAYAQCYVDNIDVLLDALKTAPGGRQQVNLAGCQGDTGQVGTRGGLIGFGDLPAPTPDAIKSVYILDESSARCLYDLISDHGDNFDPKAVFDLVTDCKDE